MLGILRFLSILAFVLTATTCHAENKDFTAQELNNKDFTNENLNKAHFDRAHLKFSKFTNATLKQASFIGADLRNANFRKANLERADFTDAKLEGACFTDAKAWYANFSGCEIHLARAEPLDLSDGKFPEGFRLGYGVAELVRSADDPVSGTLSFHYADMHDALILGNAEGVDFRGADLRGADLGHALNVDKALLTDAKYDVETRWTIKPKEAGAVYRESDKPSPPRHPLCGKWLILKGIDGAPDHGVLSIWRDQTFEWDPTLSADKPHILVGYWTEVGGKIELHGGEGGHVWTAAKSEHKGQPDIILKSDTGENRLGVGD